MSKIQILNINADQKIQSSLQLSKTGDFNTATSILITAFEERTKVIVLQLIDFGIPININSKRLRILFKNHEYRSYIGYFIDCFYEIINDLKKLIEELYKDRKFKFRVLNFSVDIEIQELLVKWLNEKVDSFINKIPFYKNIQNTRQIGLYIDVSKLQNISITKQEFNLLKEKLDLVHILALDLNYIKSISKELKLDESLKKLFNEDVLKKLFDAIDKVKIERLKSFDKILQDLTEFKNNLIG